jgi:hypothetical protein
MHRRLPCAENLLTNGALFLGQVQLLRGFNCAFLRRGRIALQDVSDKVLKPKHLSPLAHCRWYDVYHATISTPYAAEAD